MRQEEQEVISGDRPSNDRHPRHPNDDASAFPARSSNPSASTLFVADSGATDHMSDQANIFSDFTPVTPGHWKVKGIGVNSSLQVHGYGTVAVRSKVDGITYDGSLERVLYVPNLGVTLFSIGVATDLGCVVTFDHSQLRICQNNTPVAVGSRSDKDDLYYLNLEIVPPKVEAKISSTLISLNTWHQRLGHISEEVIQSMKSTNCVNSLEFIKTNESENQCGGCALGKSKRKPFQSTGLIKTNEIGQLVHSDLFGPMSVASPGGALYFMIFKDDCTGFRVLYFLKITSLMRSNTFKYMKPDSQEKPAIK